jgi:exodeoxyribonuclease VII small subunit
MAKAQSKKGGSRAKKGKSEPESEERVEALLGELEEVVEALEGGDLPLEGALEKFERGVGLVKRSETLLAGIEQRVEELLADGESRAPFEVDEED